MKKEGILKIKSLYNHEIEEQIKQKQLVESIEKEVAKRDDGLDFMDLIKIEKEKILTEQQIIRKIALSIIGDNMFSQDIYIYMGGYFRLSSDLRDLFVSNENYADYYVYTNIENEFDTYVREKDRKLEFENSHTILKFNNIDNPKEIKDNYYKLQFEYYKELLNDKNKKEAVEKIKKHLY